MAQGEEIVLLCRSMEEVLHYQCFVYPTEYRITLKGRGFLPIAELVFRRGESGHLETQGDLPKFLMGKDDYLRCVDILRNEISDLYRSPARCGGVLPAYC